MIRYENIGAMDCRKASQETLSQIASLRNVGVLILSEGQMNLLNHVDKDNIGTILTVSQEAHFTLQNGNLTLDQAFFESLPPDTHLLLNGDVTIKPLSDPALVENVASGHINGCCYVPNNLLSYFSSRFKVNGCITAYAHDAIMINRTYTLNDDELYGLKNKSKLHVMNLLALSEVSQDLLLEKIESFTVEERLITTQSHLKWLAPLVNDYGQIEKVIIPDDATFMTDITLTPQTLGALKTTSLYVDGTCQVEAPVELLLKHLTSLTCKKLIVSAEQLEALQTLQLNAGKIQMRNEEAIQNMSRMTITKAMLEDSPISIENMGKLIFDDAIQASHIENKITSIVNMGKILCPDHLYASLMKKTTNLGAITCKDANANDSDPKQNTDKTVKNSSYIVL